MNLAVCILLAVLPVIVPEKLKYISMPKEPLQDTSALNPVQQKNWKKYARLYRTFMMQSGAV